MNQIPVMSVLVLIGVLLGLGLLALNFIRFRSGPAHPSCGRCGYFVQGIPTFICPECGSDLRQVGIVVPTSWVRSHWRTFAAVLAWTLLVPVPGMFLLNRAKESFAPLRSSVSSYAFINCTVDYLPVRLQVSVKGHEIGLGRKQNVQPTTMTIWLTSFPQSRPAGVNPAQPLTVDLATGSYYFSDGVSPTLIRGPRLDAAVFERFLAARGFDPASDYRITDRAKEFVTIINAIEKWDYATLSSYAPPGSRYIPSGRGGNPIGPLIRASPTSTSPATLPTVYVTVQSRAAFVSAYSPWTGIGIFGPPILVWFVGTYAIVRRQRRREPAQGFAGPNTPDYSPRFTAKTYRMSSESSK